MLAIGSEHSQEVWPEIQCDGGTTEVAGPSVIHTPSSRRSEQCTSMTTTVQNQNKLWGLPGVYRGARIFE